MSFAGARASERLPYQLYLYTNTHVFMEWSMEDGRRIKQGPVWQLPSDNNMYDDKDTRARMV